MKLFPLLVSCALVAPACTGYVRGEAGHEVPASGSGGPGTPGSPVSGGATGDVPPASVGVEAPLRRLTHEQYNNTIRDLLGIEGKHAADFGADEEGGGFASNHRAPVSPLQVEYYQLTAERLAEQAAPDPASLLSCAASQPSLDCIAQFIRDFGVRAYRRPLLQTEIDAYSKLFELGRGEPADVASGLGLVISTMLQSPHFLYRVELGEQDSAEPSGLRLTPFELATRLSTLLHNTMPDAELLAAAGRGELRSVEQIGLQARRLLEAPRALDSLASFHQQWLGLGTLPTLEKSEQVYPEFTPELRAAMEREVRDFVAHVLTQADGRLQTLLTAGYGFPQGPLAELYGVAPSNGAPVAFPARQRAGLFTLASAMAVHSHPDQSSPVVRGYIVSDKLLCVLPPPPPPNLEIEIPVPDPSLPTRQRFEQHRADPTCAACHQLMDPLGFAFEHYDGIGRYRTQDGASTVDASSVLSGTDQDGPVADAVEMLERLTTTAEVRSCVARHWFRYAFGRPDTEQDRGTIQQAMAGFAASDYRIADLLVALTTTTGFRYRPLLRN